MNKTKATPKLGNYTTEVQQPWKHLHINPEWLRYPTQFRIRFFSIASNQDLFSIVKLWFKNGKERVFGRGVVGIKKCEHNFISEENSNRWYFDRWSCYIKTNPNFWSFMLLLLLFSFDTKSLKLIPWSISSFMTSRWLVLDVFFGWNSNFWTFENIFPTLEQTTTKK